MLYYCYEKGTNRLLARIELDNTVLEVAADQALQIIDGEAPRRILCVGVLTDRDRLGELTQPHIPMVMAIPSA